MERKENDNRKRLIKIMRGEPQFYEIVYSVDIKGLITIWGGEPCEVHDFFIQRQTEDHLHLYDGWNHGADLVNLERQKAGEMPREALVRAFLEFRKTHPTDGFGLFHNYGKRVDDGTRVDRDDKEEIQRELKKRNRQYIFELYGEKLPLDFDFSADYDKRLQSKLK